MSEVSARLSLPYLQAAQAQKHVTHNEALERLDLLVQLTVQAFDAIAPPASADEGQVWALGAAPVGAWAMHAGELAAWSNGGWLFIPPRQGWRAALGGELRIWSGSHWAGLQSELNNLMVLGINATADASSRLAVSAPATLFSHEGGGHQLKVNKQAGGDTASLLFQTAFSGRAEMGTAGDDDFSIKVSADGVAWQDGIVIDAANGLVAMPNGATVGGAGIYHRGNVLGAVSEVGGTPAGAVIESGSGPGGHYIRLADGTQQCWAALPMGEITESGSGSFADPYRTSVHEWFFEAEFSSPPVVVITPFFDGEGGVGRRHSAAYCNNVFADRATGICVSRCSAHAADDKVQVAVWASGRWFEE